MDEQTRAPAAAGVQSSRAGQHESTVHDGHREWDELVVADDNDAWRARTRISLSPVAAPSIMGLFGFMIATLMLGAWQAGWYGGAATPLIIWPLALVAGGVLQSIAAIVSFRARDGVAVAAHTAWGSFWIAWGIMQLLVATGVMPQIALGTANASFAFWFIGLTLITTMAMLGALAQNIGLAVVLGTLSAASALTAAGFWSGSLDTLRAGGWLFVISAAAAWLVASEMMLEHAFGRTIIPLGKWTKSGNVPGHKPALPLSYRSGMPGVRVGQ